ncbi:MAG: hypothetical protein KAI50_15050 [Desulfobacterales bacterium]|nr:hypothetical protein [Desulfobacterales bacterium]
MRCWNSRLLPFSYFFFLTNLFGNLGKFALAMLFSFLAPFPDPFYSDKISRLMTNLKLAKDDKLTSAGALMFSKNCEILQTNNITGNIAQQYKKF